MLKKKKILLICLASLLVLLLFTVTILPLIVRSKAIAALEDETGRKVRIEKVTINPFTLTVSVKGFAIETRSGQQGYCARRTDIPEERRYLQGTGKGYANQKPGRTECHCAVNHDI